MPIRFSLRVVAVALLLPTLVATHGATSAQVGEPRRVDLVPSARTPASTPHSVAGDLSARPRQQVEIPAAGPSRPRLRPEDRDAHSPPPAALRVYDRDGGLIPGALQVGPHRILDPRTGHHHDVHHRGDALQVVPRD